MLRPAAVPARKATPSGPGPSRRRLDRARPFTTAQGREAGIEHLLDGPGYRRVIRGVWRHVSLEETALVRVEASLLVHPATAFASRGSAARVYGVPLPHLTREHVTVQHRDDRRRRELFCHHLARADDDVRLVQGLRVSAPAQMFCELAEELGLVDLVAAGDWLVRWGLTGVEEIRAAARQAPPRARRLAVRAAGYVRAEVDSPMESRLRMLLVLAGLPEPTINLVIRWEDGRVRYRFDLGYPQVRLAIEYDGQQHRADLDQWDSDLVRDDWFAAHDWHVVKVVARGVYRTPEETLQRIHTALVRRRAAGVPRRLGDEWRQHFPQRS